MTNKEFKNLIKKHQVHQSFIVVDFTQPCTTFVRYYKDTVFENLYAVRWTILDTGAVDICNEKIDLDRWRTAWEMYISTTYKVRKNAPEYVNIESYPMQQRKFWKLYNDTIKFMLSDKRVSIVED